ncbi:MAG: glycoside hydrolase domain-containing protein, partial [Methylococcaceae bacterium]
VIGAPLFKKITLKLENGKQVVINAPENNAENRYIQSVAFNQKEYTKNFLKHSELMKGATIDFKMGAKPNMKRGIEEEDVPYSFSREGK